MSIERQDKFEELFWSKVSIPKNVFTECWNWTGAKTRGYGHSAFTINGSRIKKQAHRIAYELIHGLLDEDEVVRHKVCDNPLCCNPNHLARGSQRDNIFDMLSKGRGGHGKRERLRKDEVTTIRELWSSGDYTHESLAPLFKVTRTTILKVVNRLTWKKIP